MNEEVVTKILEGQEKMLKQMKKEIIEEVKEGIIGEVKEEIRKNN